MTWLFDRGFFPSQSGSPGSIPCLLCTRACLALRTWWLDHLHFFISFLIPPSAITACITLHMINWMHFCVRPHQDSWFGQPMAYSDSLQSGLEDRSGLLLLIPWILSLYWWYYCNVNNVTGTWNRREQTWTPEPDGESTLPNSRHPCLLTQGEAASIQSFLSSLTRGNPETAPGVRISGGGESDSAHINCAFLPNPILIILSLSPQQSGVSQVWRLKTGAFHSTPHNQCCNVLHTWVHPITSPDGNQQAINQSS